MKSEKITKLVHTLVSAYMYTTAILLLKKYKTVFYLMLISFANAAQ